jgi:hypothetical protein
MQKPGFLLIYDGFSVSKESGSTNCRPPGTLTWKNTFLLRTACLLQGQKGAITPDMQEEQVKLRVEYK